MVEHSALGRCEACFTWTKGEINVGKLSRRLSYSQAANSSEVFGIPCQHLFAGLRGPMDVMHLDFVCDLFVLDEFDFNVIGTKDIGNSIASNTLSNAIYHFVSFRQLFSGNHDIAKRLKSRHVGVYVSCFKANMINNCTSCTACRCGLGEKYKNIRESNDFT